MSSMPPRSLRLMFLGAERSSAELDDFWRLLDSPSLAGRSFRFRGGGDADAGVVAAVVLVIVVTSAVEIEVGVEAEADAEGMGLAAVPHISTIFLFTAFVF